MSPSFLAYMGFAILSMAQDAEMVSGFKAPGAQSECYDLNGHGVATICEWLRDRQLGWFEHVMRRDESRITRQSRRGKQTVR